MDWGAKAGEEQGRDKKAETQGKGKMRFLGRLCTQTMVLLETIGFQRMLAVNLQRLERGRPGAGERLIKSKTMGEKSTGNARLESAIRVIQYETVDSIRRTVH